MNYRLSDLKRVFPYRATKYIPDVCPKWGSVVVGSHPQLFPLVRSQLNLFLLIAIIKERL